LRPCSSERLSPVSRLLDQLQSVEEAREYQTLISAFEAAMWYPIGNSSCQSLDRSYGESLRGTRFTCQTGDPHDCGSCRRGQASFDLPLDPTGLTILMASWRAKAASRALPSQACRRIARRRMPRRRNVGSCAYKVLKADNDERRLARMRPASEKRRGTKSAASLAAPSAGRSQCPSPWRRFAGKVGGSQSGRQIAREAREPCSRCCRRIRSSRVGAPARRPPRSGCQRRGNACDAIDRRDGARPNGITSID
jgi:hypothetical protein